MGEIGISYQDYISLSFGDLLAIQEGYLIREQKKTADFREIGWLLVSAFSEEARRPKSMKEWWPLQIDNIERAKKGISKKNRISKDQWAVFINRMK